MSYMKDKAIDAMNEDKERLLGDIFQSIRMTRWEANYVSADKLAEVLDGALEDEAVIIAKKILNRHGM